MKSIKSSKWTIILIGIDSIEHTVMWMDISLLYPTSLWTKAALQCRKFELAHYDERLQTRCKGFDNFIFIDTVPASEQEVGLCFLGDIKFFPLFI